jgi:hypothetical protein
MISADKNEFWVPTGLRFEEALRPISEKRKGGEISIRAAGTT